LDHYFPIFEYISDEAPKVDKVLRRRKNIGGLWSGEAGKSALRKRKHQDEGNESSSLYWRTVDDEESLPSSPAEPILVVAIETYFSKLQPWISFLHKPMFKAQLKDKSFQYFCTQ
jgi:hypothetical protein